MGCYKRNGNYLIVQHKALLFGHSSGFGCQQLVCADGKQIHIEKITNYL